MRALSLEGRGAWAEAGRSVCHLAIVDRKYHLLPITGKDLVRDLMMSDSNEHPFSNASFSNTSFDPETVDLLSHAFEDARQKIQISGFRLGRPA
jgi:hypothetical protein